MINWQGTVISQYNQSPTFQTLLYAVNQWLDPTQNLDDFYDLIWNVDTAEGYGLDVWGRIVAIDRVLKVQSADPYFGFDEATTVSAWPFNTQTLPNFGGIFYNGGPLLTANYRLSDDGFRTLILAKAAFNICDGSIPGMNRVMLLLFGTDPQEGGAYVLDNRDMSMTYVFHFIPTAVEAAIISQSGIMPRPTGVSVSYQFLSPNFKGEGFVTARPSLFARVAARAIATGGVRANGVVVKP